MTARKAKIGETLSQVETSSPQSAALRDTGALVITRHRELENVPRVAETRSCRRDAKAERE